MSELRWTQSLDSFNKAFRTLDSAVMTSQKRELSDLEKQGLIQTFEITHEASWKCLKRYFEFQGNASITGSRDATREAFSNKLIDNGKAWMEMIESRNHTSHTYNKVTANDIADKILKSYHKLFAKLLQKLEGLK